MFIKSSFCDASTCPEVDLSFARSNFCEAGSCPEVGIELDFETGTDTVLFRDSEDPDTVVRIKPESWKTFVAGVKAGEFDLA